jgi:hypothetical protein
VSRAEWSQSGVLDLGLLTITMWRLRDGGWQVVTESDGVEGTIIEATDPAAAQDEARRWARGLLAEALERVGVEP